MKHTIKSVAHRQCWIDTNSDYWESLHIHGSLIKTCCWTRSNQRASSLDGIHKEEARAGQPGKNIKWYRRSRNHKALKSAGKFGREQKIVVSRSYAKGTSTVFSLQPKWMSSSEREIYRRLTLGSVRGRETTHSELSITLLQPTQSGSRERSFPQFSVSVLGWNWESGVLVTQEAQPSCWDCL